jgi:uncharacterized protein (UPF0548 family)
VSARPVHITAPVPASAIRGLADLERRTVNFDPGELEATTEPADWHVDRLRQPLPSEVPGRPEPGGAFETAREVLELYEFADQGLVRAAFHTDVPLEGRDMMLVGRFSFLRFLMGVRIGGVVDEETEREGRAVHRYAWHYRTLEGHLEEGQMDYELLKWHDTGEVELRILARSRRARRLNPVVRLGFEVFGRRQQLRFYDAALSRTLDLVAGRRPRP